MGMLCAKVDVIVCAMCESCLTPHELAGKAGVSVNIVYRMRWGFLVKMDAFTSNVLVTICPEKPIY